MGKFSQERLEERILKTVANLIVMGEIKNGKVSKFVSPVRVDLSSDNTNAMVFISGFSDDKILTESINALNRSSSFIQSRIANVLKTKNTPRLKFVKDESIFSGEKVNSLIDSINSEDK